MVTGGKLLNLCDLSLVTSSGWGEGWRDVGRVSAARVDAALVDAVWVDAEWEISG